jgi:hypothetical protein
VHGSRNDGSCSSRSRVVEVGIVGLPVGPAEGIEIAAGENLMLSTTALHFTRQSLAQKKK